MFRKFPDPPELAVQVLFMLGIDRVDFLVDHGKIERRTNEELTPDLQTLFQALRMERVVVVRQVRSRVRVVEAVVSAEEGFSFL
jgi:hypothetical protein